MPSCAAGKTSRTVGHRRRKGWLYQGIFDRVAELGLEQQVRFLGFVADEDLPPLYSGRPVCFSLVL